MNLAALWYRARDEEIGILVRIPPEQDTNMKPAIYAARKATSDPSLADLIMIHAAPGEFWICKKATSLESA